MILSIKKRGRLILGLVSMAILFGCGRFYFGWSQQNVPLNISEFVHENGYAYIARPESPAKTVSWRGQSIKIKYKLIEGDSEKAPARSQLRLFENGLPLGPAHSMHDSIRAQGKGRFSHWGKSLYISTSDNSDPGTNGRSYTIQAPVKLTGRWKNILHALLGLAFAALAVCFYSHVVRILSFFRSLWPQAVIAALLYGIIVFLRWNRTPIGYTPVGLFVHGALIVFSALLFSATFFLFLRHSRRNVFANGLAKFMTLVLCLAQLLLMLESFCRIFPLKDTLAVNPGIRHFWPDWVYYPLNSDGYREKEFSAYKAPGTYRIFVVGDSYIEGAGLRRDQTVGTLLEQELKNRFQSSHFSGKIEVYNIGRCGVNTVQEFSAVRTLAAKLKPDLVIMAYVTNDAEDTSLAMIQPNASGLGAYLDRNLMGSDGSYLWYRYSDFKRHWLARFRKSNSANFTDYTQDLHRDNARGWIITQNTFSYMNDFFARESVDWFYVIWPILVSAPVTESATALYGKIETAMKNRGVDAYNLLPYFLSQNSDLGEFAFSSKDCHPNEKATRALSVFLADRIVNRKSFLSFLDKSKKQIFQ